MSRPPLGLAFDPNRPVVTPVDAATVLVVRDRPGGGVEVFCVQRHASSPFMGGAIVFPGGKVDASDASVAVDADEIGARGAELGRSDRATLYVAAARELLEEAALVPAAVDHAAALGLRAAMKDGATFGEALRGVGVKLALSALVPFARWITPEAEPRRFDTRFFVLRCPDAQEGEHDNHETTIGFWAQPSEVLAKFMEGHLQLAPPTTRCLELLSRTSSVDDVIALAKRQSLKPICPLFVPGDPPFLAIPGDPAHAERVAIVEGPTRFVMRDGKLVSEDPPA